MTNSPELSDAPIEWAQVLDLVTRLDASSYADVDLELPGLSLHMSQTARPAAAHAAAAPAGASAPVPAAPPAPAASPDSVSPTSAAAATRSSGTPITAPILGVFYGRPAPDKPPFVEVGADVTADTTVAIVEVMKMMNTVTAGRAGRITEVCATDGQMVEFGDPLFYVEESAP